MNTETSSKIKSGVSKAEKKLEKIVISNKNQRQRANFKSLGKSQAKGHICDNGKKKGSSK